jgi:capsular polysaccharide biosynthesis protein
MVASASSGFSAGLEDDVIDHPSVLVRRWWPLVAAGAVIGAVLGVLVSLSRPAAFETRVQVLVGPVVADVDELEGAADLARTYGEVVESRTVIESAARQAGMSRSSVSVSAAAGRDSSTLSIRVRTPEASATPRVAEAVVDGLRVQIRETGGNPDALNVIDNGGGRATNQALGIELGAALGALAGIMLAAAGAMAFETRRDASAWSRAITGNFGRDLGILDSPPVVPSLLTHRYGRVIATDDRPVHRAELVVEETRPSPGSGAGQTIVFVGAHSGDPLYAQAVLQLVAAFERTPALLDPLQMLSETISPRERTVPLWRYHLSAGGRRIARFAVPAGYDSREIRSAAEARQICRDLVGEQEVVVVFVPVNHRVSSWRHWAAAADHSVMLLRPRDLDHGALRELATMLDAVPTPVLGGIHVRRRFFAGRISTVDISLDTTWWLTGGAPDGDRVGDPGASS